MLVVNQKYKPIITKPIQDQNKINEEEDYNSSIISKFQGKGINELIQKVKDIKIKEIQKKNTRKLKK